MILCKHPYKTGLGLIFIIIFGDFNTKGFIHSIYIHSLWSSGSDEEFSRETSVHSDPRFILGEALMCCICVNGILFLLVQLLLKGYHFRSSNFMNLSFSISLSPSLVSSPQMEMDLTKLSIPRLTPPPAQQISYFLLCSKHKMFLVLRLDVSNLNT